MAEAKANISGSENRQRQKFLNVRVTDAEKAQIDALAAQALMTTPSYVRHQLLDLPPPRARRRPAVETEQVARVLAQLGKIGSNLNQIAHRLNTGQPVNNEYLARTLTDVSAMRDACFLALGRKP